MASAQVLPSSRKQEHLEAGRRRLEEFRKKKAAEKAKKAAATSQTQPSDVSIYRKSNLESEHARVSDSDGIDTSGAPDFSPLAFNNNMKAIGNAHEIQNPLSNESSIKSSFHENDNSSSSGVDTGVESHRIKKYSASGISGLSNVSNGSRAEDMSTNLESYSTAQNMPEDGSTSAFSFSLHQKGSQVHNSSNLSNSYKISESKSTEYDSLSKVPASVNSISSLDSIFQISPQNSVQSQPSNASMQSDHAFSSLYEGMREPVPHVGQNKQGSAEFGESYSSDPGERKLSSSGKGFPSMHSPPMQRYESSGFDFDVRSSSNYVPSYSATNDANSRRSRPSFLDSLNVNKATSGSLFQRNELGKDSLVAQSSQLKNINALGSSSFHTETGESFAKMEVPDIPRANEHPTTSAVSGMNGGTPFMMNTNETSIEKKREFYTSKQNEDFAALEQHIEDLTQEKFSLQRALEASRALAESLAAENSSLTDNYNQQRSVVNQLKSDMENLQEEIKAQLAELESFKMEYSTARLECNAADERANILASEVIGLEEKALRLRSNELKLERQLENSQAEIASYKKKVSSLEKDRQDLQSTIDALQEEKKLLQSRLRKASSSGKSADVVNHPTSRKDMSTSTEDLGSNDSDSFTTDREMNSHLGSNALTPEDGQLSVEASLVNIPPDQMRVIQNINALISELALEKEELKKALSSELSQCSKLEELNKELSRKLEIQTQRLELLTAQSMAGENISARQTDPHIIPDNIQYADEGDEVVERVLGWIMKLFPGGPSRRRSTKRL